MGTPRALALALILAAVPATALAQSAKDKQKAGEKVKAAISKSQAGDHEGAIALYEEAYKIIPQPLLLSNIGSEYQAMKKPVEAMSYFCKYLEAEPEGSNAGYATAQAKTLYIELGGVDDVKDADVCKPIVKKPPPDGGGGNTSSTSGGGGGGGGGDGDKIPDKQPDPPPVDKGPEAKASPLRWVGVGTAVLGAGVFGLGIFYGLKASSISDDITNHPMNEPWPRDIAQMQADGESYEKKQIYFMVGGGIALAAGAVLFFVSGPKKPADTQAMRFTPVASPDGVGFAASGSF